MTSKQTKLFPRGWLAHSTAFGGSLLKKSNPKVKRIFKRTLPMHIVMRSENANGTRSLIRLNDKIEQILQVQAAKHHIKIYAAANAGNHLHLLIQAPSREQLSAFLKGFTGRVAQLAMGTKTEKARDAFDSRFWDSRPWTRLVSWGKEFRNVLKYIGINTNETNLRMNRAGTRAIFAEIQDAFDQGLLRRSPTLIAAGFG